MMNLIANAFELSPEKRAPSHTLIKFLDELDSEFLELQERNYLSEQLEVVAMDDNEHLGIGAAMPQDILGMELLDSCRRNTHDTREDSL